MAKAAKAKQEPLPGVEEQPEHPALERLASELYDVQQERIELQQVEKGKRKSLEVMMQQLGVTRYKFKNILALIETTSKAFVRAPKDSDDADAVESRAEVRETDEQLEHIKAAKPKLVKPEPTPEESQENVETYFDNADANEDVAELLAEESDDTTTPESIDEGPNDRGLSFADYLKYAGQTGKQNPASWARLAMVKRNHDEDVFDFIFGEKAEPAEEEVPLPEDPRDQALLYALTSESGSFERWQARRERFKHGIPDKELEEAIREEFTSGQHERGGLTYFCDDKPTPKFWFGPRTKQKQAPTLQGVRLLAKAREVLGLKAPVKTKVTKNTRATAHA